MKKKNKIVTQIFFYSIIYTACTIYKIVMENFIDFYQDILTEKKILKLMKNMKFFDSKLHLDLQIN